LYHLASRPDVERVFEFGSGFGYSAYWLARALSGQRHLVLTERDEDELALACDFMDRGGFSATIQYEQGDALAAFDATTGTFDLVLFDHENDAYPAALEQVRGRLSSGGILVADNVMTAAIIQTEQLLAGLQTGEIGDVNEHTRGVYENLQTVRAAPAFHTQLVPIGGGLAVSHVHPDPTQRDLKRPEQIEGLQVRVNKNPGKYRWTVSAVPWEACSMREPSAPSDAAPAAGGRSTNRGKKLTRRTFLAGTGAATVGALGGCLGAPGGGPASVTFGTLTIPSVAEVLIAKDKGYFADRNIELEIERIQSAPKATPQLANGDLDVATGSIGASLFNSVAQGIDINVVADQTQYWRGQPSSNRILFRTAAVPDTDSIYDIPEGLTIGLHGRGNVDSYIWGRILALNDMTWADVNPTSVLYTNMPTAMAEGKMDACAIPDPLGLQVLDKAPATRLGYASMVAPRMQIGAYLFGGPFMTDRPEVATRWLEAYLEGVREYYELGGFPSDEVATIVNETFGLPKAAIKASIPSLPHRNGYLNEESIGSQQAYHACRGAVDTAVDVSKVVDQSLLDTALDAVGRLDESAATPSVETIQEWSENALAPYPPVGEIQEPPGFPGDAMC
jgi:predicted O-methyltransferase YrrM/ABC-type nitrate/sulfonate/bicarbonate transport system substrate-binding protein